MLVEKYLPGIRTKDEDLNVLMDRFRTEIETVVPYLEKPEMLRIFRDIITPYLYVKFSIREEQPYRETERQRYMKIVNQQMCQLVGDTCESFTWIAHISDPQISAQILERFMATKQPEDIRIIQGRPDLYSIPLIKVMGIDKKEQTPLTKQHRSLAYVFFDWKRMACLHPRIQRNLINKLHEQIRYMKRFRTVPYRQLPNVFNSYTLQELEELIYEIYVTAIVTA
jgi:hypothetical protein